MRMGTGDVIGYVDSEATGYFAHMQPENNDKQKDIQEIWRAEMREHTM